MFRLITEETKTWQIWMFIIICLAPFYVLLFWGTWYTVHAISHIDIISEIAKNGPIWFGR